MESRTSVKAKVVAIALIVVLLGPTAYASVNMNCEVEVLNDGGRAYVGLIRAGLEKGDLTKAHLEQILEMTEPSSPQLGGKLVTNHALRGGFARALKILKKEEWPTVLGEVALLRQQRVNKEKLSKVGQAATKAIFNAKKTGVTLDSDSYAPQTFVSSSGEIFILIPKEGGHSILWNFTTGEKTQIPYATYTPVQFYETLSGQILLAFTKMENPFTRQYALILSIYDLHAPQRPLYQLNLGEVRGIQDYMAEDNVHQFSRIAMFEVNGFVKVAYYPNLHDAFYEGSIVRTKPVVLVDLLADAHTVLHLPNVKSHFAVADDGRFYFAGLWKSEDGYHSTIHLRDVLEERDIFRYEFEGKYSTLADLYGKVATGPSGRPAIYLGHEFESLHGMIEEGSREMIRVDPFERSSDVRFKDRSGDYQTVSLFPRGVVSPKDIDFHIGPKGRYENYYFPKDDAPENPGVSVTAGTYGEILFFSSRSNTEDSERIQRFHVFNRVTGSWFKVVLPRSFNTERTFQGSFYDVSTNRVLGFAQTRDRRWILLQYFGH